MIVILYDEMLERERERERETEGERYREIDEKNMNKYYMRI